MDYLNQLIDEVRPWLEANKTLLWSISAVSFIVFLGTLIAVPWIIVRMSPDHFLEEDDPRRRKRENESEGRAEIRLILRVLRNTFGIIVLLTGIAMLLLPGQGLLTILIGMSLIDFPGKRDLERSIVRREKVHRGLNWLRAKAGRPPLIVDPSSD